MIDKYEETAAYYKKLKEENEDSSDYDDSHSHSHDHDDDSDMSDDDIPDVVEVKPKKKNEVVDDDGFEVV